MAPAFGAIKGETYSSKIARGITAMIANAELRPGDVLPPQRELSKSFKVSGPVVREALGVLAARGLISVQHGRTTTINPVSKWNTLDPAVLMLLRAKVTLRELMELRFIVEPDAASLAAQRISNEELNRLRALLDPLHNTVLETHVEADTAFHQTILRATHNTVLQITMNSVVELLLESRRATFQVVDGIPRSAAWHCAILQALERHDAVGAREKMLGHLTQVEETLNQFLERCEAERGQEVWLDDEET